ncbi:hypothetical protein FBY40_1192 [Microbacterium sp. SLBN-154]|uniref:hypothetical protein n=1 Tax=Microbacterium sp. SLBN-154 TaxID=2768458 RepID=UPI00115134BF|nr:hypothetical protein [Microbacterium sp. SLBN-154]TQK18703.1 hypothetical protein FBY40_1192 [Microbacterium sp. SLBN-154]
MRELKIAIRQLERAHHRSLRFARRVEARDPELAARARREADDLARVLSEYRLLARLEAAPPADSVPAESSPASADPADAVPGAAEPDRDSSR